MITFQNALNVLKRKDRLDRPIPFDIEFVTANAKMNTGGEVRIYNQMVFLMPKSKNAELNANHFLNGTINIMPNGGGPITKVHLMLIRKLNNMILV